jgi:hypothetical protein
MYALALARVSRLWVGKRCGLRDRSRSHNFANAPASTRTALITGLANLHPSPHRHCNSSSETRSSSTTPPKWSSTLLISPSARAHVRTALPQIIEDVEALNWHSGQLERCEEESHSQLPGLVAVGTLLHSPAGYQDSSKSGNHTSYSRTLCRVWEESE